MQKMEIKKIYPLTPMQEGMLYHSMTDKNPYTYLTQLTFKLKGELEPSLLQSSFQQVVNRYDILRTIFNYDDAKQPIQMVINNRKADIHWEELLSISNEEQKTYLKQYCEKDLDKGFDLTHDLLIRLSAFQLEDKVYQIVITLHHIVMDGWCLGSVIKEIFQIYHALSKNTAQENLDYELGKVYPYSRYISWLQKQDKNEAEKFWKDYLVDYNQQTMIPKEKEATDIIENKHARLNFVINSEMTSSLIDLAKNNKVTISTLIHTIWGILLKRYNNVDDVVFGSVISGRHYDLQGIEKMVGLFINTVPVRIKMEEDKRFTELLEDVQHKSIKAQKHSYYPLSKIQNNTELKQTLVNHIVAFENLPIEEKLSDLENDNNLYDFSLYDIQSFGQTSYDFNMIIVPGKELRVSIEYKKAAYSESFLNKIEGHMKQVANTVIQNPEIKISEIDILTWNEKKKLLFDLNDTMVDYPKNTTVHQLFEKQVKKHPNKPAIFFEGQSLTYSELNQKANQIARKLRKLGVEKDVLVGMLMERSLEMIIGILAILKAGGAYVPISPDYPEERINYTLSDCGANIILSQKTVCYKISNQELTILNLDEAIYEGDSSDLCNIATEHSAAYVIYTSGTTGKPKGTVVEHYNVVRLLINSKMPFDFSDNDVWSMFHTFCFDFSVWEMYGALLYGGKLIIISKETTLNPQKFLNVLANEKITVLNQVPSSFYNLISEAESSDISLALEYIIFGGEALKPRMLKGWKKKYPTAKLINMYGITETTVHVTYKEITKDEIEEDISNIGKAIPTLTTYIMDKDLKLVPIGVAGELCVGGEGCARGYLNRRELTSKKFITNPYKVQERMYRSGDLVRMCENGEMEYLGRIDRQIKIRGFRIEIGEIETQILRCDSVIKVAVIPKKNPSGSMYLCAYIVASKKITIDCIREELLGVLPDYMIPSYFVQLEDFPLTLNGKIDDRVLPEPDGEVNIVADYVPPKDEIQEILVNIWKEVLGISKVGINDNFFACGGDSIKALQISSRLKKYDLHMEIKDLFQHLTIAQLSGYIKATGNRSHQGPVEGTVSLTPIQKMFFDHNMPFDQHFNQSVLLYKSDGFDKEIVNQVFTAILEHHDALRMKFTIDNGKVNQINQSIREGIFELQEIQIDSKGDIERVLEKESEKIQASVNLLSNTLVRLALFKSEEGDYLLIVINHLVVDGVSWRIILEDFESAYTECMQNKQISFQAKTDSYKDWSEKINAYSNSEKLLEQIAFWKELEDEELIHLPKDHMITESKFKDSMNIDFCLTKEDTQHLLQNVNQAYNTEINDILLAALCITIREWSGLDKILIDLEGHGREEILDNVDICRTVGWFTSVYPLFIDMTKLGHFTERKELGCFIKHIKERIRHIPDKGIGYGILKYLSAPENKQDLVFRQNPDICFNYLGQYSDQEEQGMITLSDMNSGKQIGPEVKRQHSLEITGCIKHNQLNISLNFNRKEYEEENIKRCTKIYKSILEEIISYCISKEKTEITPSDMTYNSLSMEELDDFVSEVSQIF
ncbi:MAG: amino acid adenylation domain-containing protein [Herbinix sp.]|nr:amino acid adenylation domain-containing protein [Herbinix sp.]